MEDHLQDPLRPLQVPGYAFWPIQCLTTFHSYVNKILAKKLFIFIIVYVDDILIYTKDPGQLHVEAVRWVLNQL